MYIYIRGKMSLFCAFVRQTSKRKKARKKFDGVSSRQGGKPIESDTILYYYSITLYHVGGTFQPKKRDFRSENRIAVLLSA